MHLKGLVKYMVNNIYGNRVGWLGRDLAMEQFDVLGGTNFKLNVVGKSYAGKRMMLYELVRKVYGKDTPNYAQINGSCVSFGAKNAIEHCQAADILIRNQTELLKLIYPPYLYGCGRVFIGGGKIRGDGSLGVWQAQAVQKYGAVPSDTNGIPKYNSKTEEDWSYAPGPPQEFVSVGKQHLVKTIGKINNWSEAVEAICNGCGVTIASNRGFNMQASSDGFHAPHGRWDHQMSCIGVNDGASQGSYGIILNSWGPDAHGHLKDFDTGEDLPPGVLRVRAEDIDAMIKQDDSWAYSAWDGFPDNNALLEESLFDVIGN